VRPRDVQLWEGGDRLDKDAGCGRFRSPPTLDAELCNELGQRRLRTPASSLAARFMVVEVSEVFHDGGCVVGDAFIVWLLRLPGEPRPVGCRSTGIEIAG
jgi:hypothetical protein